MKCLSILLQAMKKYVIWICPMERVWFCFISVFCVHFSHKIEKFWFWKLTYFFFWQNNMRRQIWICLNGKISYFVSFPFFVCVHFSHKTEKFTFWKSWKYFVLFYELFSKERTIINKHNEIKLNKTNKTLRNNLAYYLLWEKGL